MIEEIKRVISNFESGQSGLDIYNLAFLIKDITEDKLEEVSE